MINISKVFVNNLYERYDLSHELVIRITLKKFIKIKSSGTNDGLTKYWKKK